MALLAQMESYSLTNGKYVGCSAFSVGRFYTEGFVTEGVLSVALWVRRRVQFRPGLRAALADDGFLASVVCLPELDSIV